jgi:hypothetical protein
MPRSRVDGHDFVVAELPFGTDRALDGDLELVLQAKKEPRK